MKKVLISSLLLFLLLLGCSSSDDDGGGTITPVNPDVTVYVASASPDMTDPASSVWDGATAKSVEVAQANTPKVVPGGKATAVPANITIQALTHNDSLFMRFQWVDADHSVWPGYYEITTVGPPIAVARSGDGIEYEDQLFVMFSAGDLGWDIWNWRSLTTDAGGVAEDMYMATSGTSPTHDASPGAIPSHQNWLAQTPQIPAYVSIDTSEFTSYILPEVPADLILYNGNNDFGNAVTNTSGWTLGQRIPAYRMETDFYDVSNNTTKGSRFEIRANHAYNDVTHTYMVVMARKLNTGNTDDLNMSGGTDITFKVGVYDNQGVFATGSNNRGFTGNITLKF